MAKIGRLSANTKNGFNSCLDFIARCALRTKKVDRQKNLRASEASEAICEGGSWFLFSVTSFKRRISPRTESQSPKLSRGGGIVLGDEITWVRDLLRRKRVSRCRGDQYPHRFLPSTDLSKEMDLSD